MSAAPAHDGQVGALPADMRAIAIRQPGGPDVLEMTRQPLPAPGPGDHPVERCLPGREVDHCEARQDQNGPEKENGWGYRARRGSVDEPAHIADVGFD